MRGDGGVAGEGRAVGVSKFYSWGKCTMSLTNIKSDNLNGQRFLWPVYYIIGASLSKLHSSDYNGDFM